MGETGDGADGSYQEAEFPLFLLDQDRFVPSDRARGPWHVGALHGGAVAALLARVIECHEPPAEATDQVVRLTVELLRPVPVDPLSVESRTLRRGRRTRLIETSLLACGREVGRATALAIRTDDTPVQGAASSPLPGPDTARRQIADWAWQGFHNAGVEIRFPDAVPNTRNRAWIRLNQPVVNDEVPSPLVRASAAADFGNGIGAVLPLDRYRFVNPDLTVYLSRSPSGEWICVESTTHLNQHGSGVADSALYDVEGRIGRSAQALLVEAVPPE